MIPARTRGSITLEAMIALAVFVVLVGSVELLLSGSAGPRYFANTDELALAKSSLASAREKARTDFFSLTSTSSDAVRNGQTYQRTLEVVDETPCVKEVNASAGQGSGTTTLSMLVANAAEEEAEGGDCEPLPLADWYGFGRVGAATLGSAHARALDALFGTVYIGIDIPPYLAVADAASGALIPFTNGFALRSAPNALDAAMINGRPYVFAVLDATSSQFAIIDMRSSEAPSASYFSLAGVDPYGESPEGYRVRYYGGYAYASARYTAGPELHIFDVSEPRSAYEAASTELGVTVNDFVLRDEEREGEAIRLFYAASSDKRGELRIYDATNPRAVKAVSTTDLPEKTATHHPAESIALLGREVLIGRSSGPSDPDLFVYEISDAAHPSLRGSADAGTTVASIEAFDDSAFLGTTKSGKQLELWSLASTTPSLAASYAIAGLGARALDYEDGRIYAAGTGAPFFEVLQSL